MKAVIRYRSTPAGHSSFVIRISAFSYCLLFTIYCLLSTVSCTPERDNPYDPQSPNYKATAKGRVTNMVGAPLKEASVSTIPMKFIASTNSDGEYIMSTGPGTWRFTAQLTGYVPDTTGTINIAPGETKEINFLLNGMPVVENPKAIACQEDRGWPVNNVYWGKASCEIQDPDGIQDIDSVWFVVDLDTADLTASLTFVGGNTYETGKICETAHNPTQLELLIGHPFTIYARDTKGTIGTSEKFYIPRIIYKLPYTESPASGDSVSPPIEFVWRGIKVTYPITYTLIILTSSLETVLTKPNILDTVCTVDALAAGSYFWRVEAVDEFGDFSRSGKTSFVVQ